MKYRPEIDGLRSIAVVSVIVYHAGFSALGGGFLGVDVFFVISGFLITSLIISDLSEGVHFVDLAGFYCSSPNSDDTIACRVFAEDGRLISHDSMHLTQGGAEYFGGKVVARLRKIGIGGLE